MLKMAKKGFEPLTPRVWTACSSQLSYLATMFKENKWDLQGSNLWPSACKADALPAELRSHILPLQTCLGSIPNMSKYVKNFFAVFLKILFKSFNFFLNHSTSYEAS